MENMNENTNITLNNCITLTSSILAYMKIIQILQHHIKKSKYPK